MDLKLLNIIVFLLINFVNAFSQQANCELLNYNTICTVNESNKLVIEESYMLQINNRSGEKYTKIEIPYSKNIKVTNLQGSILDQDGAIVRKLRKSEIEDVSAISSISLYEDDYVKKFQLKHNNYPYRVAYSYKKTYSEFMYLEDWYPIIDFDVPTRAASLKIITPKNYDIKYYQVGCEEPVVSDIDGNKKYVWNASYDEIIEKEIYSPSRWELLPNVKVVPTSFSYAEKGSCESWKSYGNWQYNLNIGLDELPLFEKVKIDDLTKNINDDREKVKILYHYLQDNTRYISVQIDIGGFRPYSAEYVAGNKYGDCKALSNYMFSMLKQAGIKSFYTKIHAGDNKRKLNIDFPAPQFNHIILCVPFKNDTIWLECTSNTNPCGYIGTFTQDRYGFLIEQDKSRLIKTPTLSIKDVKEERKFEYKMDANGSSYAIVNCQFRGSNFEAYTYLENSFNDSEKDDVIHNILAYSSFELNKWEMKREHRDSAKISLLLELNIPNFIKNYGSDLVINTSSFVLPRFEEPGKRTLPVKINYPVYITDSIMFELPGNSDLQYIPENIEDKGKFGEYFRTYVMQGSNKILLYKIMVIYAGNYKLEEYHDFYKFISALKKYESQKIVYTKN